MKKVDILYFGNLNQINGANKVIQTQSGFSKFFHEFEINKVYTSGGVIDVKKGERVVLGKTIGTKRHSIIS